MGKLHIVQSMAEPIVDIDGPGGKFQIARERLETLTEQLAAMSLAIDAATQLLVTLQDIADPDPDASDQGAEDDFVRHPASGPGCPVADCGEISDPDEDGDEDYGQDEGEPDYQVAVRADGPGCLISDPDSAVDDMACDELHQDLEPEEGV